MRGEHWRPPPGDVCTAERAPAPGTAGNDRRNRSGDAWSWDLCEPPRVLRSSATSARSRPGGRASRAALPPRISRMILISN